MKIHEYQAKAIFKRFGLPVLPGIPAMSVEEAVRAAEQLGGPLWVVKAQIHAGGRGKAGGVKLARSVEEVRALAGSILGSTLVTKQTGPKGKKVERLYIESGAQIARELYAAVLIDRASQLICIMASSAGGMDIEEVAATRPEAILKVMVDPAAGIEAGSLEALAGKLGFSPEQVPAAASFFAGLYEAFMETDASLVEVNPMAVLADGSVIALDAKMSFDDNALFRHPDLNELRDLSEEDPLETEAKKFDLSYIALDGSIACMVNGAGLAMATMDSIKLYGGEPANFLDVGGGASVEKVTAAFRIMLANPRVKAILVNIFGGIMRCDTIAEGIVAACREVKLSVPLVVRMNGTNEAEGRGILAGSGLPIIPAANMAEAAQKIVAAAKEP
ncbi:MAG: ADP-forming succinate--CoA ligase subunit beta [Duodenibacillus sp.]|nr:ADP-forming succinate--CoA ligase subunit beta [Duodenibacillus sp.]